MPVSIVIGGGLRNALHESSGQGNRLKPIRKIFARTLSAILLGLCLGLGAGPVSALTLQEAVAQVERETGGKILSAETIRVGPNVIYRIKVLTPDGRIRVFQLPA